ncbi:MAG TPA: hypothetical protein VE344_00395 [Methylomirabilota bacterium]|nr:hypothetical protein [Methylomirabilota bacterium]
MGIIDFILNLAGLLLWLNWRAEEADPVGKRKPATLIGTLRRADSNNGGNWKSPAIIGGLILLRALFYWQIGSVVHWVGKLNLGVIELSFRSDFFGLMLVFSIFSFVVTLGIFYLCLLLLSVLDGPEPFRSVVRLQLGGMDGWRRGTKLFLPPATVSSLWWLASWLLAWLQIIPQPASELRRLGESLIVGLGSYSAWKFLAVALILLHLVNSYIYFGKHPFWNFVNAEAQTLLTPLKKIPLRLGKMDFSPVVATTLIFLLAGLAERLLNFLYGRLQS